MEFKILGPLEICVGEERLKFGGLRQQTVVATLLLSANRVVTTDRLLEAIYGEDLPPTARSQAQISVSSLRRLLTSYGSEAVISTHPQGYVLQIDGGRLDAGQFEELVAAARAARDAGQPGQAVACYRDALRLWRGPALDGIDSQLIQVTAARLDEQRITTIEDRIDLELELGRHHELVGEITELVEEHPLREHLLGQLMLALYRCDRAAEALQAYRQARRTLIDELGMEPGSRLQQLEHDILNSEPALYPPAPAARVARASQRVPNLLPTDIADFTGRDRELSLIRRHLLPETDASESRAVPVVVLTGKGGVGKTSIGVHAAHELASHFADGQLFADLHGAASHHVAPLQVLDRFIRTMGPASSFASDGLDEHAEVYRNLLAGRRVLIMLDDAEGESQVAPLLPGHGAAAVIITSRRRLTALPGAVHIEVDVFEADKSLDLLARIAGEQRVGAEHRAAARIAQYCGNLPLALRIAGARLSARPHWSVEQLSNRLARETRLLDELTHSGMGIRPSISLSYMGASDKAKRLFRRLALLDLPWFASWMSAALLDLPVAEAEDLLDELVSAQLVETTGTGSDAHSRYRFHELVRAFAREQLAANDSAAERKAALDRVFGGLLHLAQEAQSRYYGGPCFRLQRAARPWTLSEPLTDDLLADPLKWYDDERAVLVAAVRQASQAGAVDLCWNLAVSAVTIFQSRTYLDDWQETHDIAFEATKRAQDVRGQAAMLYSIGSLRIAQQRFDQAGQALAEAARLFADIGDDLGTALVLRYMAYLDTVGGRLAEADARYEQALATFNRTGDKVAAAYVLNGLSQVKLGRHDVAGAKELLGSALRLSREARCRRMEAQVFYRLGEANLLSGSLAEAVDALEMALAVTRDIGDLIGEAYVMVGTGIANVRLREFRPARHALQRALELAVTVGQPVTEARALLGLSELALTSGNPGQAVVYGQQASGILRRLGALGDDARAISLLSQAHAALGGADADADADAAKRGRPVQAGARCRRFK